MSTAAYRRARDEFIASIPWVRPVTKDKPCDGVKWGKVALKHLYPRNRNPPEGIPDSARCRFRARWHFTARRNSPENTGDYCWHHLGQVLTSHPVEWERYHAWQTKRERAPK